MTRDEIIKEISEMAYKYQHDFPEATIVLLCFTSMSYMRKELALANHIVPFCEDVMKTAKAVMSN